MDNNERAAVHRERDRQRGEVAARTGDLCEALRRVPVELDRPVREADPK